ncbi:uncharacterized protein YbjT (DUF2867 family) [Isoptericola jiangsuensis]|uniref:Uncharacterized protein YbjT (DUF2867 family) n=1 Tax=Isoptericola jiangsuensis TaxID=548579 RepID=A0A2A9EQR5_9MICO|nr:NAD(P)H-binding protein [Isoptericola jiangsuensis]PFG41447.1 uncharacterized protein YbjT (DUF2867 family) [Isoptericola jiangsuensis]
MSENRAQGMRVAVAGATGTVGRHVVDVAREHGHEVVPLTRSTGVDLTTGSGLTERLAGVDAVVDVTNALVRSRQDAEAFFGGVTRTLLAAERAAGVGHHVALSIIGVDDVPWGYYQGKQLQERLVAASGQGWSVLRAAQLHEFAGQVLDAARLGPVSLVPRMLSQPVAGREVGEALVDLVERGPQGRVPDLAGPEVLLLHRASRRLVRARALRRLVVPVPMPGAAGRGMRDGSLTAQGDPGAAVGRTTFDAWLAALPGAGDGARVR